MKELTRSKTRFIVSKLAAGCYSSKACYGKNQWPRNIRVRLLAPSAFTRQRQSTSAESTAQINILIQKLGLEVLCFIPTLTVHCYEDCVSDRFSFGGSCVVLITVLARKLFQRAGATATVLCLMLIKSSIFEHVSTSVHQCWPRLCLIAIVILPIGYLPWSAHPRASARHGPVAPAGTATSCPTWPKALARLEWMAAFEECATFTCSVSLFTCRTRLFSALQEKAGMHL